MSDDKPAPPQRKPSQDRNYSAYSAIQNKPMTVTVEGLPKKVSAKTALHWKTFEEAIQGKVEACREVLEWIDKRELERAKYCNQSRLGPILMENNNPVSMDEALIILGIAVEDQSQSRADKNFVRLQSWVAQRALERSKRDPFIREALRELRAHTQDPETVSWPGA